MRTNIFSRISMCVWCSDVSACLHPVSYFSCRIKEFSEKSTNWFIFGQVGLIITYTSSLKLLMCDIKYFGNILSTFSRRRWRTSFWGNLKEDESFAGKLKPYSSWCPSYDVKYFYIFCKGFLWRRIRTIKILLLEMPFIAHPKKEWVSNKHSVSPKQRFYVWKSTKPNVWTI